ncbi:LOW QUALITY PROTEIN: hypothetical protein CFOL_v3_30009, partial [Cephalotus follicularis]
IQCPALMRSSSKKRDTKKYCRYHRDHGHDTEECRHLTNQIEDLISKGHLHNLEMSSTPYLKGSRLVATIICLERPMRQSFIVQQYQHSKMLKKGGYEEVISFSEADYEGVCIPHDDPVAVTLLVELFTMKIILIDSSSSADILYKHVFDQLSISTDQLKPVKTPLVDFAGDMVHPLGSINLSVVAGTTPCTQVQMTFLVVDTPSPYNAIIGRPVLNLMEA